MNTIHRPVLPPEGRRTPGHQGRDAGLPVNSLGFAYRLQMIASVCRKAEHGWAEFLQAVTPFSFGQELHSGDFVP